MKYKTGDLSKILNVSTNTIRRYEEKGYLNPIREENNGYRYFGDDDVSKMVYISKYRKFGFGHNEIGKMIQSDFMVGMDMCEQKMAELDKQIATLSAVRHMLYDDIALMKRVAEYGSKMRERDCVEFYYVAYQKDGKVLSDAGRGKKLYEFMYMCPEIKYCYIFRKENVLKRRLVYEDAIAIKKKDATRFDIAIDDECIESYDKCFSVMRVVKLPIDFANSNKIPNEEARKIIFDEVMDYIKEQGYSLAGDVIAIRIGFSKESGKDNEYVLLSFPVENKK